MRKFPSIDVSIRMIFGYFIVVVLSVSYISLILPAFRVFIYSNGLMMILFNIVVFTMMYVSYKVRTSGNLSKIQVIGIVVLFLLFISIPYVFQRRSFELTLLYYIGFGFTWYDLMTYNYQGPYLQNKEVKIQYYVISVLVYCLFYFVPLYGIHLTFLYRRYTRDIFILDDYKNRHHAEVIRHDAKLYNHIK